MSTKEPRVPGNSESGRFRIPVPPVAKPGLLIRAVAGLHAGIAGVIWMFGWFVVAAIWGHRSIWAIPNLFSTLFYGDIAYQDAFLRSTWAGLAVVVALYGLLGALWGLTIKLQKGRPPILLGAFAGLAVYYLFFSFLWPYADPEIPLYAPIRELQVGHIIWGIALSRCSAYLPNVEELVRGTSARPASARPESAPPDDDQSAGQSVSGEIIT